MTSKTKRAALRRLRAKNRPGISVKAEVYAGIRKAALRRGRSIESTAESIIMAALDREAA